MPVRFGSVLSRKLLRDLWARKVSIVVLVLIMTVGTGGLITMLSVYRDLDGARADYYREYRLADFWIDLKRAPESVIQDVAESPNVASAYGRVAIGALLDLPNLDEPIGGLVISMPEQRRPVLNDLLIRSGTWFSGRDEREAILNDSFAKANGIRPGMRMKILLLDEQHEVLVVGTAMSPEYVYLIPADGGIAPDPARFGVIYMPEDFLQRSADQEGAYNQILGKAFDHSPEALRRTLDVLEESLDTWGVTQTTPLQDQPSVRFLRDELAGLRASARIMPGIFLGVALLVLNVLMTRMVVQQRTTVGTLKALGRSTLSIALHYVTFGMVVGTLGGLSGMALTLWLQPNYVSLYGQYYALPNLRAHFYPDLHFMGMAVSIAFACFGAIRGARHASQLQPADAMRPPPPEKGGKIWLENVGLIWNRLSFRWRLVLRAIFRNPFRSVVGLLTVIVSTALMLTTFNMLAALNYLMDYQFNALMHQDVTVALRDPVGRTSPDEIEDLPGVAAVEPQLNIVSDLINGPYEKRIGVTGLPSNPTMFTPLDDDGNPIVIPPEGIVLTEKLAEILHVQVGDTITLRPLIGRRETVRAPVVSTVQTFLGLSAYANIEYLSRLIGEDYTANSLLAVTYNIENWQPMYDELRERPTVVGVSRRDRALQQMQRTFGETQGMMLGITIIFAGLIAFGSVLNTALVSLSEREREVGTLRVLGYSPGEVAAILRGEQLILSFFGIALGVLAGIGLSHLVAVAYNTELYRFPVVIKPGNLAQAAFYVALFIALAQTIVYLYIRRVKWLDALKIKE